MLGQLLQLSTRTHLWHGVWSSSWFSAATTTYAVRTECYETLPWILEWVRRYQAFEEIYTSNGSDGPIMTELEETLERLYVSLLKYETHLRGFSTLEDGKDRPLYSKGKTQVQPNRQWKS